MQLKSFSTVQVMTFFSSFYIDRIDQFFVKPIVMISQVRNLNPLQKYNILKIYFFSKSKYIILPHSGDLISF